MRFAIAAGGTGGHFFPGVALAEAISERVQDSEVFIIGRRGGPEALWAEKAAVRFRAVSSGSPLAGSLTRRLRGLLRLFRGFAEAALILLRLRPRVVVGFGGYASVPCVLAAAFLRCPIVLHEQNFIPGKATRLLAPLAVRVAVSFRETAGWFGRRAVLTGFPIRKSALVADRQKAAGEFGFDAARRTVLIVGGSQGARELNLAAARCLPALKSLQAGWQVLHLSGAGDAAIVEYTYRKGRVNARVIPFLHSMGKAYSIASLAVSRAGAATVAELSANGIPAVYVPYPGAGFHQAANARAAVRAGAAVLVSEPELAGGRLAEVLAGLMEDEEALRAMSARASGFGRRDGAERLAEVVVGIAGGRWPACFDGREAFISSV